MVFSESVFLYVLFPLAIGSYFLCRNLLYRNLILLGLSLLFYAWGEPIFVVNMVLASLVAYVGGLLIDRFRIQGRPRDCQTAFVITTILLIGNLGVFKYLNFFCDNLELLLGISLPVPEIRLPIGISFYTFQILSYVIDLYRGKVKTQRNFLYLTLYVSFFPQLIAGPIVRYETVEAEIRCRHSSLEDVTVGLKRFIRGMAKKVILANNTALIAEIIYGGDISIFGTGFYWVAAVAYTLQIYFDFSGYSDMAIGLGRIFGFHFLENFDAPYTSRSVTEFWRRWHISLSTWFRDYVYIPLGGNRVSRRRWLFNTLVVWFLTGLWHGAQWNFVLWGLYNCAFLLVEKRLAKVLEKLPGVVRWLYTMIAVCVGWVIFNLVDFGQMKEALHTMFLYRPGNVMAAVAADSRLLHGLFYLPLAALCCVPWKRREQTGEEGPMAVAAENLCYLAVFGLCILFVISSSYNPFIYFRF